MVSRSSYPPFVALIIWRSSVLFYFIKEKADRLLSHSMTLEYIFLLPFPSVWSNFLWNNKKEGLLWTSVWMLVCSVSLFCLFSLNKHLASGLSRLCIVNTAVFSFFSNSLRSPFFFIMLLEHLFCRVRASYTDQQSSFLVLPNSWGFSDAVSSYLKC